MLVMIGITYGIRPYGGHPMGWTTPFVLASWSPGVALLVAFAVIETRVADPMFRLELFRIRAFTFGVLSSFLSAVARGGLMFMLIIWLQGIWLPEHGYSFRRRRSGPGSPCCRSTLGFLIAGPTSGHPLRPLRLAAVRDRRDARLGARLRPAHAAPDRLLLSGVRRHPVPDGALDGRVRLAEPRRRDEQPARPSIAAPAAA